jgi:hypothetical protein
VLVVCGISGYLFRAEEITRRITRDVIADTLHHIETDTPQEFVSDRPRPRRIRCSDPFANGWIQMMINRLLNHSMKMVL